MGVVRGVILGCLWVWFRCELEHEHARGLGVTTADMGMYVGVVRGVV